MTEPLELQLADMTVLGMPPAKLIKAAAVIATCLHSEFELQPRIKAGISRESCVLCSLTVRDFLRRIGFRARVRVVAVVIAAFEGDQLLHSVGIGAPDDTPDTPTRWTGHMVAEVAGWMIDTTLFQAIRPQWRGHLKGMLMLPLDHAERSPIFGLRSLTSAVLEDGAYAFGVEYLDNPSNTRWKGGADHKLDRRREVVRHLVTRFGAWDG